MNYQFKKYKYGLLDNGLTKQDINSGIKITIDWLISQKKK